MLPEVDEASSSAAQLAPVDYCSHTNFSLGEVAACQAGFIQCFKDFSSCALRHYSGTDRFKVKNIFSPLVKHTGV